MGVGRAAVRALLREGNRRPYTGEILTLGRQHLYFTPQQVQDLAAEEGYALRSGDDAELNATPSDTTFFAQLGFDRYETLDYSSYEGASLIADLNLDTLPEEIIGRFDVVLDGGTMEHVFHVPNAFKNIHRLLAPGGRVIHIAPSSNHIDHGFYMYSPTLFWDYYTANGYEVNTLQLFRYRPDDANGAWLVSDYRPGGFGGVRPAPWDGRSYGVFCIATKGPAATCDLIPQQHAYQDTWHGEPDGASGARRALLRSVRATLERAPGGRRAWRWVEGVRAALGNRPTTTRY